VQVVVVLQQTMVLLALQVVMVEAEQALLVIQHKELLELPTLEVAQEGQVIPVSTASTAVQALLFFVTLALNEERVEQLPQQADSQSTHSPALALTQLNKE
jgi:hypothetical protein